MADEYRVTFNGDDRYPIATLLVHYNHAEIKKLFEEGESLVLSAVVLMPDRRIRNLDLQPIPAWEKSRLDEETRKIIEDQAKEIARLKQLLSPTEYPHKLHPATEIVTNFEEEQKKLVHLPKDV